MPNTREKLIELLRGATKTLEEQKEKWILGGKVGEKPGIFSCFADHLIANGVTLANQVASSSKQLASSKWIPVTERLPDETKDEYVLVSCDYYGKIKVETRKMWHIDACVTHWMPLPEPPKGESNV